MIVYLLNVDRNFFDFFHIKFKEGQGFDVENANLGNQVVVNEAYVKQFSLKDALSQKLDTWNDDMKTVSADIIGVTEDFKFGSLKSSVKPVIIRPSETRINSINIRVHSTDIRKTIASLKTEWDKLMPGTPFEYEFLDDHYDQLYKKEQQTSQLFQYFTLLAIIIACMGLVGLTVFTIKKRTKELGIRKVFGAEILNLALLLTKDIIYIFPAAFVISAVGSYYYMQTWMENFAYHVKFNYLYFLLAAGVVLLLSYASVSFQTIRASKVNPANLLREE